MESEDARLEAEARRVYQRYQREVVEGLAFCPYAERARTTGAVAVEVMLATRTLQQQDEPLAAIARLAPDEAVDIGLLIFPRLDVTRVDFEKYVATLRATDTRRWPLGGVKLVMAAFHPEAEADLTTPERLVPFIRRSPDPTIQLVRRTALAKVRGHEPTTRVVDPRTVDIAKFLAEEPVRPLSERIARANLRTVIERSVADVQALLDDIRRDRAESYARLGVPTHVRDGRPA